MGFKQLFENYEMLCKNQQEEVKDLMARHDNELKELKKKHYAEVQSLNLCDYFEIGDIIELGMVDYMPTKHYTVKYVIVNTGSNYLVGFIDEEYSVEILTWESFRDAKFIFCNGEKILVNED